MRNDSESEIHSLQLVVIAVQLVLIMLDILTFNKYEKTKQTKNAQRTNLLLTHMGHQSLTDDDND